MQVTFDYMKLAFCPTGPGGGIDNSCSSKSGTKYAPETTKRVILAAQASIKAKNETNNIKAAQLHGKAARANEKAAKALDKDPAGHNSPLTYAHYAKMNEHEQIARDLSQKLLGASAGKLQQYKIDAATRTTQATTATKLALGPFGKNVKFYGSGAAPPLNKAIAYAKAYDAHTKAAVAHDLAHNAKQAEHHRTSAKQMEKEFEHYRGMI